MYTEENKREIKVDNSAYRDRFRFLFSVNDNIVCERFFKINHFNMVSLHSEEMKDAIETIVSNIQNDMKSKSRIYMWYTTTTPVKITGFMPGGMGINNKLSEYVVYPEKKTETDGKSESQSDDNYEATFKFDFQMAQTIEISQVDGRPVFSDYKSVYTAVWDGTVYPREVRNNVDLSNSLSQYRGNDVNSMNFYRMLGYRMVNGKKDLIVDTIKCICEAASGEGKIYTTSSFYGTERVISEKEGKNFRKYEGKRYNMVKRENGIIVDRKDVDVYRSADGKCYVKREDGNYMEVVEYSYDPYGKYFKSWESAVRGKTDAYRKSIAYML